jgi:hypothetical protein
MLDELGLLVKDSREVMGRRSCLCLLYVCNDSLEHTAGTVHIQHRSKKEQAWRLIARYVVIEFFVFMKLSPLVPNGSRDAVHSSCFFGAILISTA